ncbi:MAG TPA: SGNH family hydrolase [Kaistia sp.]|nr:SGNH family hydrolase [Kaistia sp.]
MRQSLVRLALLLLVAFALPAGDALAQARGGFFERLFGGDREVAPPPGAIPGQPRSGQPGRAAPSPQRKKQATTAAPAEPVFPVADIEPKDADARRVLVIGDFVAGGLAWGLDQAFADDPKLAVLDNTDGSSGLVRDDHYDWTASLPDLIDETRPDVIVVMIGINDRQPIRTGDGNLAVRSDGWDAAYAARVERFVAALKASGKPVFWVGEPPMRSTDGSADMAFINTVFKEKAEAAGMRFIDIWDGFADEDGKFVSRGPDMDGQARQLRSGDGINFTKSGRRKLAFYVERELDSAGGGAAVGTAAPLNPNDTIEIGADGKPRTVGPIVSLTDPPPAAADTALAGAAPAAEPANAADPVYRLTVEGVAAPAPPGRADDFTWKAPRPSAGPVTGSVVDGIIILPVAAAGGGDASAK